MTRIQALPVRTQVRDAVARAWERAVASGALPAIDDGGSRPAVEIARPAKSEHGDLSTNLAMKLARPLRRPPLDIARAIAGELAAEAADGSAASPVAAVDVAPPGFINLRLADRVLEATIAEILAAPADWGRVSPVRQRRMMSSSNSAEGAFNRSRR